MPNRSRSLALNPVPLLYMGLWSTSMPRDVSGCITTTSSTARL